VKFTRSVYPLIPGREDDGSPCWQLTSRLVRVDADWNTRFPFGVSFGLDAGPDSVPRRIRTGFLLELNAPLGEPNRLYVHGFGWHITLGLPAVQRFRETGRERRTNSAGREITVARGEHFNDWLHPYIDGLSRYRYHQDECGKWVRNEHPEPRHWGWLTIERTNRAIAG
jgi:hypothetical protein